MQVQMEQDYQRTIKAGQFHGNYTPLGIFHNKMKTAPNICIHRSKNKIIKGIYKILSDCSIMYERGKWEEHKGPK